MEATERLLEIKARCGDILERIVPLDLDGQTLRLILYLKDGTNLRLAEHHTHLNTFPHHKHVGRQDNLQPSSETRLEAVLTFIRTTTDLSGGE